MQHALSGKYKGKDRIDQGVIVQEFLTDTIKEIGKEMFPGGSRIHSASHVQTGDFCTCGEIVAVSLAQGGPPPCFLDRSAFRCIFEPVDIANMSELHLTRKEKESINLIRNDVNDSEDLIIENGYTASIHEENIDGSISSVKVSFLNKRILYTKEFAKDLNSYRILDIISDFPDLFEKLFIVRNDGKSYAKYLSSCISPQLSEHGSLRRQKEESIINMLQDI